MGAWERTVRRGKLTKAERERLHRVEADQERSLARGGRCRIGGKGDIPEAIQVVGMMGGMERVNQEVNPMKNIKEVLSIQNEISQKILDQKDPREKSRGAGPEEN